MPGNIDNYFCALPWTHSFVNLGGEFQVCCTSEEFHKAILDDKGNPFFIQDNPKINDVMNSNFMKKIRKEILSGKLPELCTRCINTEKNGGVSRRVVENFKMRTMMPLETLIEQTASDASIPIQIKTADYRLGNVCNLECRMCHPSSSAAWIKNWNPVKGKAEQLSNEELLHYQKYDWVESEQVTEDLLLKIGHLEHLHFAGGEPLFASKMAEMLQICIDHNRAQDITLSYNTNITRLPTKVTELWSKFKEVRLYCSIDGHGNVNDYIRTNSKWKVIDENLKFIDQNADDMKISKIILSTTFQAYNALNVSDLYEYIAPFKNISKALNLVSLYMPDYLQTQVLPLEIKKEIEKRLLRLKDSLMNNVHDDDIFLVKGINDAINHMNASDLSHLLPEFLDYNDRLDKVKGMRMQDYIPELYSALKPYR